MNEVPRRVITDVAGQGRAPFFRRMLDDDRLVETVVSETLPREMYPSQTWASLNTGVAWSDHRVWWYGDPKPVDYPLYWQAAARAGRSVGLVSTLHSSPLSRQCTNGDYRFVIPDCFAGDDDTLPHRYRPFQQLNLRLTRANSRKTNPAALRADLLLGAKVAVGLGLSGRTMGRIAGLMAEVATGLVPRERLRTGQFLVLGDVFMRLLTTEVPDLAVIFTNHVAAAMHRYWYAMYPDDFGSEHYSAEWVERHRDEIPVAVELLDRFLDGLDRWCRRNQRVLIVTSSMGQGPSGQLDASRSHEAVVADPRRFLSSVGIGAGDGDEPTALSGLRAQIEVDMPTVRGAMAPNLTLDCQTVADGQRIAEHLRAVGVGRPGWVVDRVDEVVTLTYDIEVVDGGHINLVDRRIAAGAVGVVIHEVDDHSSGRHTPEGVVVVSNSTSFKQPADGRVDYLDFAPAMLDLLGVARLDHHREPMLQL